MNKTRVHTCVGQEHVAQGLNPPPAPKCRCRKQIPTEAAVERVKTGEAKWVVVERVRISGEQVCHLCKGDPEVKKCANCGGVGEEQGSKYTEKYGNDIVLVSRASVDPKDKKYPSALRAKTPRVAAIEANHIHRAYVSNEARSLVCNTEMIPNGYYGNNEEFGDVAFISGGPVSPKQAKAARDRIEEYGRLIRENLKALGAGRILAPPDPEDAPKPTSTRRGGCIHSSCLTPDTCSFCKALNTTRS